MIPVPKMSKKRKNTSSAEETVGQPSSKIRTRKRNLDEGSGIDEESQINEAFSQMDGQLLADYLSRQTMKFESDLSPIELDDKYISANSIHDTTSWNKPRTLENLPHFLECFSGGPSKLRFTPKKNGSPHTILVAGAGLRAANLARIVRKYQDKDAVVAKLFAKHIKLKDAARFLRSTRVGVAVGTPTRLNDLIEDGALIVDELQRIIIDASHIDAKKRGILEMKETHEPLIKWLNRREFKDRFGLPADGIDLIFY